MSTTPIYMVTVVPGLEDIASSEIISKLPGSWIQAQMRGRVLFAARPPGEDLQCLRCVDNIYLHLAWLKIGLHKADLDELTESIDGIDFPRLLHRKSVRQTKAIVNASRSGAHRFSRFDAAHAVLRGLTNFHGFVPGTPEAHDFNFRLDVIDHDALLSLKLTAAAFRFRGQRTFSRAALRPPIAHALVWLSEPTPDDVFLDPFCGSGTIPAERATYPAASITGGDISPAAVKAAKHNAPAQVSIRPMDACDLRDIASGSVSSIVTNLPWGKQITPEQDIERLYSKFLCETKRVMAITGRAIMLTDQKEALEQGCSEAQLQCQTLYSISLHGALASIYLVRHAI